MENGVAGASELTLYEQLQGLEGAMLSAPEATRKNLLNLLEEARTTQQPQAEAYALCLLGGCSLFMGNYADTLLFVQYALPICQKEGLGMLEARCLNAVGLANDRLGRYDESLPAYLQSLQLANKLDDKAAQCRVLVNLASTYSTLEDHQRALELYQEGEKRAEQGELLAYRADAMRGIVEELSILERFEEAFETLPDALHAARDADFRAVMTKLRYCEGQLYLEYRQLPEAFKAAKQGLKIAEETGDREGVARGYWLLGECSLNLADYASAYRDLSRSEKLAAELGLYSVVSQTKRSLAHLMEIQGEYHQALIYLKEHLEEEEITRATKNRYRAQALSGQVKTALLMGEASPADKQPAQQDLGNQEEAKLHQA